MSPGVTFCLYDIKLGITQKLRNFVEKPIWKPDDKNVFHNVKATEMKPLYEIILRSRE